MDELGMRRRWCWFLGLLSGLVAGLGVQALAAPLNRVELNLPGAPELARHLEGLGWDVLEGQAALDRLELVVTPDQLTQLEEQGYAPRILEVGRPFAAIQAERQAAGGVPPGYLDLDGVLNAMTAAATTYPAICQLVDLTAEFGLPTTYEGRHLYAVKISDQVATDEDEPTALIVSAHHCRELVTPVIALHAIDQLTSGYGVDPAITQVVDAHEIWIAPVWNPDGYVHVFTAENLWRKNRRVFQTAIGVDLNRNYPLGWDSACAGSTNPSSLTYRGPAPSSEMETVTMIALSQHERFAKVIDYHSSGREVLHGYGCLNHPLDSYLETEAIALAGASGYLGSHRPPTATGEHFEWQLATYGAHAFLVETHDQFQPDYSSATAEAAQVWPGILWMLEHPTPLWGHVTDQATGLPVSATFVVAGLNYEEGEVASSNPVTGRYHAFLPAASYTVTFGAPGYHDHVATGVEIVAGSSLELDVALVPITTAVTATTLADPPGGLVLADFVQRSFRYRTTRDGAIRLKVYDALGRSVDTQVWAVAAGTVDEFRWQPASRLASGLYLFQVTTPDGAWNGKWLLAR